MNDVETRRPSDAKYVNFGLTIVLFILVVPIVLIFAYFSFTFKGQSLSQNISDWGSFGDYIGGTTAPLVSIITLFVTVFIAYEISHLEEKRTEKNRKFEEERNAKNLEFEEKRHLATIEYDRRKFKRELREKEYLTVSENLERFWDFMTEADPHTAGAGYFLIKKRFNSFLSRKEHLFPELNLNDFEKLDATLYELIKLTDDENYRISGPEGVKQIDNFTEELNVFHKKMQEYLAAE